MIFVGLLLSLVGLVLGVRGYILNERAGLFLKDIFKAKSLGTGHALIIAGFLLALIGIAVFIVGIINKNKQPSSQDKKDFIYKLTTSAILVALSTVLSLIKVWQMPLGGAITLLSMIPVCLISILYGTTYAILPCLLYGTVQIFLDNPFGWGLSPKILIGSIFFDYLIAFGVLCLAGVFKKYGNGGIVIGVALACLARFASHFISGCVLFSNLEQWDVFGKTFVNRPVLYSVCYNGIYMLPELVITVVGMYILCKSGAVNQIKKMTERK